MNKHLIDNSSTITGLNREYKPDGYIDRSDKGFLIKNCIVVFCYLAVERYYFDAVYYDVFTDKEFFASERHHFVYIINSDKNSSEDIINDIKGSKKFRL